MIHLDLAFPPAWVAVECDGRGKYATGASFTTDRIRWTQASPHWSIVWVEWTRWRAAPAALIDEIVVRVAGADPSRAPAVRADCRCRRCSGRAPPPG